MKRYIRQNGATNGKVKLEVIKDDDGEVIAYHLGKWYLCKTWGWSGVVNWYIFDHLKNYLYDYEKSKIGYARETGGEGLVISYQEGKKLLTERYLADQEQKDVTASTEEPECTPEYYYQIMNMLDDAALANRDLTPEEIATLDDLNAKDAKCGLGGGDIRDMADANDCYNPDGSLCSTWDEMVIALRGLFESGERIHCG